MPLNRLIQVVAILAATALISSCADKLEDKTTNELLYEAAYIIKLHDGDLYLQNLSIWDKILKVEHMEPGRSFEGILNNLQHIEPRLEEVIRREPERWEAYALLGYSLLHAHGIDQGQDLGEIEKLIATYYEHTPDHFWSLYVLTSLFIDEERYPQALQNVEIMRTRFPENKLEGLMLSAAILIRQKEFNKAISHVDELIAIGRESHARLLEGICLFMLGDEPGSEKAYARAIELNPALAEQVAKNKAYYSALKDE